MMRGSSGGDFEVTVIPITRSMIFWEASEVCKWLEHLQFDQQVKEGVWVMGAHNGNSPRLCIVRFGVLMQHLR